MFANTHLGVGCGVGRRVVGDCKHAGLPPLNGGGADISCYVFTWPQDGNV